MTQEAVPLSVAADDNLRIAFVPSGSNPLSVAILAADPVKDLTYSLTPSGFARSIDEAVVTDGRLTLKQVLQRAGKVTEGLVLQYVFGDEDDVAKIALANGTEGFIVARYSLPNATAWTVAQVVDVLTIKVGLQRKDAPAENGVQTMTQTVYITDVTQTDAVLVA